MKIYRTERGSGRVIFQVADPSQGRRVLRQFTDETQATTEANRILNLLSSGEAYAAGMRSEDRAVFGRAMKALEPTGVSLEIASAMFAEAVARLGSHELLPQAVSLWVESQAKTSPRLLKDAVKDYQEKKKAERGSQQYLKDLKYRLEKLTSAFDCNVSELTTPKLQVWLDEQMLSPQSARNFRTVLTGFFKYAKARGWCTVIPTAWLMVPSMKGGGDIQTFTADEFARLLAAASKEFLPCLVLGGFCGLRSAEIERLNWEDIDLSSGQVVVGRDAAKTKSRRIVPICDAGRDWLKDYAKKTGCVWPKAHDDFYKQQAATAKATEIRDGSGQVVTPAVEWKQNGLRHGYASHRLAVVEDAVKVAHEMGNSPGVVHSHYKALVSQAEGKRWFEILPETPANVTTFAQEAPTVPMAAQA